MPSREASAGGPASGTQAPRRPLWDGNPKTGWWRPPGLDLAAPPGGAFSSPSESPGWPSLPPSHPPYPLLPACLERPPARPETHQGPLSSRWVDARGGTDGLSRLRVRPCLCAVRPQAEGCTSLSLSVASAQRVPVTPLAWCPPEVGLALSLPGEGVNTPSEGDEEASPPSRQSGWSRRRLSCPGTRPHQDTQEESRGRGSLRPRRGSWLGPFKAGRWQRRENAEQPL